jgi:exosortase
MSVTDTTPMPATNSSRAPETQGTRLVQRIGGLFTPSGLGITLVLGVAFLALFFRWYMLQAKLSWMQLEDWGHAFFVPFFSGFLIWRERARLAAIRPEPYWPGLIALFTGIAAYVHFLVGYNNHMAQGFSMILTLFGLVLVVLGLGAMRIVFLPITFLVFMIEVSKMVMILITAPLQTIAAHGGYIGLSLVAPIFGYTVDRAGNVLHVTTQAGKDIPLDIAEACSGMRMVVAFVALAAATGLLGCRFWWQRLALLLLALPVAIFINVVRVVVLGLLSLINPELASGEAHTFIGTVLLFPGFGLFWLAKWALDKIVDAPPAPVAPVAAVAVNSASETGPLRTGAGAVLAGLGTLWSRPSVVAAGGILMASALAIGSVIHVYQLHLQKDKIYSESGLDVRSVPAETASWKRFRADTIFPLEIASELGTQNYLSRIYVAREAAPGAKTPEVLDVHLAYYTGLLDAVPHVPERCFTGGGMALVGGPWTVDIPMNPANWLLDEASSPPGQPSRAIYLARTPNQYSVKPGTRVALPRGLTPERPLRLRVSQYTDQQGRSTWAGYLFIANGGWTSSAEGVRELAFKFSDDYAYFLKLQFQSSSVTSPDQLAMLAGSFLDDALADIMLCVPDWRRVESGHWPADNPRRVKSEVPARSSAD